MSCENVRLAARNTRWEVRGRDVGMGRGVPSTLDRRSLEPRGPILGRGQPQTVIVANPKRRRPATAAAALVWLSVDAAAQGPVASLEGRRCSAPGPAPVWARWASRMAEREALTAAALVVVAHRWRTGQPGCPPIAQLLGGITVRLLLAKALRRPRPPQVWWRTTPQGWSFPSRHTTHALLGAAMLLDEQPSLPAPARAAVLAGLTGTVGASRVRLGVHWPSDVAAGALVGPLWRTLTSPAAAAVPRGSDRG